jgi:ribonuclease E
MLSEGSSIPCPRCGGSGHIRDTESSALQILRIIQEESLKDSTAAVLVQVPVEVASFLLNEKRTEITKIELKQRINVLLVPNKSLDTPNYKLERLKHDDPRLDNLDASYKLADEPDEATGFTRRSQERTNKQEPVIKGVLPDGPAPVAAPKPEALVAPPVVTAAPVVVQAPAAKAPAEKGFFGWLKGLFGASPEPIPQVSAAPVPEGNKSERNDGAQKNGRDGRGRGGRNGEGRGDRGDKGDRRDGNRPPRGEGRSERVEGQARNGEQRRNEGRGERVEGQGRSGEQRRGEGRGERAEGQGRNGGQRRDNRADAAPAEALSTESDNRAPLMAEAADAAVDGGRRERRGGRNDNRRRQGSETPDTTTPSLAHDGAPDAAASTAPIEGGETDSGAARGPRERRSRDRYGRDRRGDRGPREGESTEVTSSEVSDDPLLATVSDETVDQRPARSYFTQANAAPVVTASPSAVQTAPLETLPSPVMASPQVAPRAAPAAPVTQPVAVVPVGMPKVMPFALSLDELSQVAQGSGLEWINSDAAKVAQAQAAIAAEPQPIHVPREPKPVVMVDEGPLVLVETRKDLRDVTLPFDAR